MKAASRFVVACAVGVVAGSSAAFASSPMSNGVGDGEANVPFASATVGADQDARAVERGDRAKGARKQEATRGATGGDSARARADAAEGGTGSGSVTPDELDKLTNQAIDPVERTRNAPAPAPTFTDQG